MRNNAEIARLNATVQRIDSALSATSIAGQASGIPLNQPLVDNTSLGSFWVRVGVAIGTGATPISIGIGRIPSCWWVVDNAQPAVVYRTAADVQAATPQSIVLRASVATTASLLIG